MPIMPTTCCSGKVNEYPKVRKTLHHHPSSSSTEWLSLFLSGLSVLPGSLGSRVPFVISTSIAATFAREPRLHCAFSGAP